MREFSAKKTYKMVTKISVKLARVKDDEIIRLILKGDSNYFRLLVDRYQNMVFRTCVGFIHNKDEAEDLTQEIFIQAYLSLKKFRQEASFSTWLYRIAVNASLNRIKRQVRTWPGYHQGENEDERTLISVADNDDPEKMLIQQEHKRWVQKALDSLPENQRVAIVLSKYDDLSQREIAEIMDTSEGAVEALLQRAKAGLRKKLSHFRKNF